MRRYRVRGEMGGKVQDEGRLKGVFLAGRIEDDIHLCG